MGIKPDQKDLKISGEDLDSKYKKIREDIGKAFWGDFMFGGLLVSGIFIIVENLNLSQMWNCLIGTN